MIRRFKKTEGRYIEKIVGQDRFAFAHSDSGDFHDLAEWSASGGYPGSVLIFFDFATGDVYQPFAKERNVIYSDPVYAGGFYYFLRGDRGEGKITLYRCIPGTVLEKAAELGMEEVNLYNLRIIGDSVHIISQGDCFTCYYPERFSFPMESNETAILISDGRIYFEAWIEEGWDSEKACAGEDYKYYSKVIIKDMLGNTLSEEIGSLCQAADGSWWIA